MEAGIQDIEALAQIPWERVRPVAKPHIDVHTVQHEMVLYDPERGFGFSLNLSARAVWELCDGNRTVQEIGSHIAQVLEEDADAVLPDVERAVQQFYEYDLLTLDDA